MRHYIILGNWTEAGMKNIRQSPERYDAFKQICVKHGGQCTSFHMTMGHFDLVAHVDAPDDESIARILLALGQSGSVRTVTLPAFDEAAYRRLTTGG